LTAVKKHFEDLEGSSSMRLARSWGRTNLSAGLLVTWRLRQQRCRAACPGWCERKAGHHSGRQRIPVCALGRCHSLLDVPSSCHVAARGTCQEAISVAWPGALRIAGLACAVSRGLKIQWLHAAL